MQLTLLGTGCPSVDYKRCGSANLVSTNNTRILIDCGSGVSVIFLDFKKLVMQLVYWLVYLFLIHYASVFHFHYSDQTIF